jgi:hypothetical protein
VISYAIFTLDLLNHPARAEKLLASLPMVGNVLSEDHLSQTRIQLQDVEGVYQQIKEDRLVFIVSGRAVNTSNEPLKGVQIESTIIDAGNHTVEAKSIYCGNAMSLKIVKDLSPKEISLLQRLEPTKRFEIRPGESAGFSVVFLNPPRGLREFTAACGGGAALDDLTGYFFSASGFLGSPSFGVTSIASGSLRALRKLRIARPRSPPTSPSFPAPKTTTTINRITNQLAEAQPEHVFLSPLEPTPCGRGSQARTAGNLASIPRFR